MFEANTPIVWHTSIGHLPADEAIDAAYWICAHQTYWPSIGDFMEAHRLILKTKYRSRSESHGLPKPTQCTDEVASAGLAMARDALASARPGVRPMVRPAPPQSPAEVLAGRAGATAEPERLWDEEPF